MMFCFASRTFLINMAFLPSRRGNKFLNTIFVIQTVLTILFNAAIFLALYILVNDDNGKADNLIAPIIILSILMFTRLFIVAVRYATTSPTIYKNLQTGILQSGRLSEMLILRAWTTIPPDKILKEIDTSIIKLQISKMGFTFKTLTPVFYSMKDRLIDENYYNRKKLGFTDIKKKEQKLDKEIKLILDEF